MIAIVLVSILILSTNGQSLSLCDYYSKDSRMLGHSPDKHNLYLFIEDNYWIVNEEVKTKTPYLMIKDKSGLTNHDFQHWMSTLFFFDTDFSTDSGTKAFVGFNDVSDHFGWFAYHEKTTKFDLECPKGVGHGQNYSCGNYTWGPSKPIPEFKVDQVKDSVSFIAYGPEQHRAISIFVIHTPYGDGTDRLRTFPVRVVGLIGPGPRGRPTMLQFDGDDPQSGSVDKIKRLESIEVKANSKVIGILFSKDEDRLWLVFRVDSGLQYCEVENVSKHWTITYGLRVGLNINNTEDIDLTIVSSLIVSSKKV